MRMIGPHKIVGAYQGIPTSVRAVVNQGFEQYVHFHIEQRTVFALETTLRSDITLQQARMARERGFQVYMRYVAISEEESLNEWRFELKAAATPRPRGPSAASTAAV